MFTRIIDFVKYHGTQIEIHVERDASGAITFRFLGLDSKDLHRPTA